MARKNNKVKKGFTIIEVVLVLAIAGLIFLMVFIALPALQRSQRDSQRRNDYSMLSTAVTSYITNNGGRISKLTATSDPNTGLDTKTWINKDGTDPNGYGYYLAACSYDKWSGGDGACGSGDAVGGNAAASAKKPSIAKSGGTTGGTTGVNYDNGSEVIIVTGANCYATDDQGNAAPDQDTGIKAFAIYGYLESGGLYCQDSGATGNKKNS